MKLVCIIDYYIFNQKALLSTTDERFIEISIEDFAFSNLKFIPGILEQKLIQSCSESRS